MHANERDTESGIWLTLGRSLDRLGGWMLLLAGVLLFLMLVLMVVEIAVRGIFHVSTQIADEYSGYLFLAMTMASFLYAQRQDRLMRINMFRVRMSLRWRAGVDGVTSLMAVVLSVILCDATWNTVWGSMQFGSVSIQYSQTPLYIPQILMPVGFAILGIAFLHQGLTSLGQSFGMIPLNRKVTDESPITE